MSVRITDKNNVALYDSTSGIAFGPTFEDAMDAEEFLAWLEEKIGRDPREASPAYLLILVQAWHAEREGREPSDTEIYGAGSS